MSLKLVASALALFIAIPVHAAKAKKSCEHFLSDTSLIAERPLKLPAGDLLYYYQLEGIDPFNLFQEGMDPGNENPLSITNNGQLEISVGGWAFEPGKDGDSKTDIQALSYSKERQRYLVSVTSGGGGYRILVNVDTKAGLAHVWMQDKEKGKYTEWELAGRYTNDPDKAQKSEEEDGGNEEAQSPAVDSGSDYTDFGLVGDGDLVEKHLLLLQKTPAGHRLMAFNGATPFSGLLGSVLVSEEIAAAIATGNLQALDGKSAGDKKARMDFQKRGLDYQGNPRVTVTVTTPSATTKITSCSPYKPAKVSIY